MFSVAEPVKVIYDKSADLETRINNVRRLRNTPFHPEVDNLLLVATDNTEDVVLRQDLLEALGWFTMSYRKNDIIEACRKILTQNTAPLLVLQEAEKTYRRLSEYSR